MRFPIYSGELPYLTTDQMREVDRLMIEDFHIALIQMMENAGRNLAHLARSRFLGSEPTGKRIIVLAGTGGNGGGAMVCARHLHNHGAHVVVSLLKPDTDFAAVPAHQLDILRRMGVPAGSLADLDVSLPFDLIVDGVIGYSLKGAPRGAAADMILWANAADAPVLSLDAPSGLDTTTGTIYDPIVRATATMTLALPKAGLRSPDAETYVGELYLADISVPPELFMQPTLGLSAPSIFTESDIVRLF